MTFFFHRMFSYCPSKPRNPLLKVLVGFGLVIGLGMLLFAGARRLFGTSRRPAAPPADVIEGEFTRVRDPHSPLHLR